MMLISPDIGIPILPQTNITDLRERAEALCSTIEVLMEHGLKVVQSSDDKDIAAELAQAYASNPELASKKLTTHKASKLTPASLIQARAILDEFGMAVAHHAAEIRYLVTNKLVLESENPDARIRIRALELLGKITDVGLFTDKTEVTVTHQSTEDLRKKLRDKFNRLLDKDDITDVPDPDYVDMGGQVIDVDQELGLSSG
jgi:hypothetical protein